MNGENVLSLILAIAILSFIAGIVAEQLGAPPEVFTIILMPGMIIGGSFIALILISIIMVLIMAVFDKI